MPIRGPDPTPIDSSTPRTPDFLPSAVVRSKFAKSPSGENDGTSKFIKPFATPVLSKISSTHLGGSFGLKLP